MEISTYIFNRKGQCIFSLDNSDISELIFGILHTLKSYIVQFSDKFATDFIAYSTNSYRFFVLEVATGTTIVLITHFIPRNNSNFYKQILNKLFVLYCEYVITNPLLKPEEQITSNLFRSKIVELFSFTE